MQVSASLTLRRANITEKLNLTTPFITSISEHEWWSKQHFGERREFIF